MNHNNILHSNRLVNRLLWIWRNMHGRTVIQQFGDGLPLMPFQQFPDKGRGVDSWIWCWLLFLTTCNSMRSFWGETSCYIIWSTYLQHASMYTYTLAESTPLTTYIPWGILSYTLYNCILHTADANSTTMNTACTACVVTVPLPFTEGTTLQNMKTTRMSSPSFETLPLWSII